MIKELCFIDGYQYPIPNVGFDYDYCVLKNENGFFKR